MEKENNMYSLKLEDAIAAIASYVKILDLKGRVVLMNDIAKSELFLEGKTEKDIKAFNYSRLLEKDSIKKIQEAIRNAKKGKKSTIEVDYLKGVSKYAFCDVSISPLRVDGVIKYILYISKDATDRVKIKKLKETSLLLNGLIDFNPYMIAVVDSEGHALRVNDAFLKTFGQKPPAIYSFFKDPYINKKFPNVVREFYKTGYVKFPEYFYNPHALDKRYPDVAIWLRSSLFAIYEGDKIKYGVFMYEDITEQKKLEKINKIMTGRGLKVVEMKKRIKELEAKLKKINS